MNMKFQTKSLRNDACVCQVSIALSTDLCIKRKRTALFMPFEFSGDFPFTNHHFYWWSDHQLIACTHFTITTTTLWMFFHISFSDARNLWLIFLRIIFRFIFLGIYFGNRSVVSANYPAIKYTAFIYIANDKTSLYITSSDDQLSNCICLQYLLCAKASCPPDRPTNCHSFHCLWNIKTVMPWRRWFS